MNYSTTSIHNIKKITSGIEKHKNSENGKTFYVLTLKVTQEKDDSKAAFDFYLFSDTEADLKIVEEAAA